MWRHLTRRRRLAAIVFLGLNGFDVFDDKGRLYDTTMGVARGELVKEGVAALLEELSEPRRDDRALR